MFFKIKELFKAFKPFIKYCVVGVSGTLVDLGTLFVMVESGLIHLIIATNIAFFLAVIHNFFWNKVWTFKNDSNNFRKLFIKFFIVSCGGLVLTNFLMFVLAGVMSIWYIYAKCITSAVVLTWNFLANQYWTFSIKQPLSIKKVDHDCEVTILVPAFNEALRIENTLKEIRAYAENQSLEYRVIVIDDGSVDKTTSIVESMQDSWEQLSLIVSRKNMGKGHAVRKGVLQATGRLVVFADADNSTPIEELGKFLKIFHKNHCDIIIGSRYAKGSDVQIKQNKMRVAIGRVGNYLIRRFIIEGIKDTQCGFKMFKLDVARDIFSKAKVNRWGFDMEILAIAKMEGYSIREVPVSWFNSLDSRLRPVRDAVLTFLELVFIKLNIWCGRYDEG